jgi:hypothetical protein
MICGGGKGTWRVEQAVQGVQDLQFESVGGWCQGGAGGMVRSSMGYCMQAAQWLQGLAAASIGVS